MHRIFATGMIIVCLGRPAGAATPHVPAPVPTGCAALLTAGGDAVPADARREIAARVFGRPDDPSAEIGELRAAIRHLVEVQRISPAEAEHLFTERVLGEYAVIFQKYVIAELRARDFDDDRVIYFFLNFAKVFSVEGQVDFAVAVARRMLFTINDDVTATTSKGLDQFEDAVKAFRISEDGYGRFLAVWRFVREAHPDVVVHFVLANVKALATSIERRSRPVEPVEVPREAPFSIGSWLRGAPPPPPPTPERGVVARGLLDDLAVPDFVRDVAVLALDPAPPPPVLERFLAPADFDLVDRAVLTPPIARGLVLGFAIERANPEVLARLRRGRLLDGVDAGVRARVTELSETFDRLTALARRTKARAEFEALNPVEPSTADPAAVKAFSEHFVRDLSPWPAGAALATEPGDAKIGAHFATTLTRTWDAAAALGVRFTTADFLVIARRTFEASLEPGRTRVTMALVHALMQLSRGFDIPAAERERLVKDFGLPPFLAKDGRYYSFAEFTSAKPLLVPNEWGARPAAARPGPPPLSAEMKALLDEFRDTLPASERDVLTDRELLAAVKKAW